MTETQHATRHDDPQRDGLSASEKEAMRAAHNDAITSNEKIFPVFARKLASGEPKDYISTTTKLAIWLASEKAYYPAARTKIVELLEIALSTFVRTFVRHQAAKELAEQLRKLVESVTPYWHLFPEIELQARLKRVIQETAACISASSKSTLEGPAPSPSQPPGVLSASSHTITSPIQPQSLMAPVPSPSTVEPAQPSPSLPQAAPPATVADSIPSGMPNVSSSPQVPQAASPSTRPVEPQPTLISPTTTLPQETGETPSMATTAKPQPRRLRKAELSDELKARDLDWFKTNQSVVVGGADVGVGADSEGSVTPGGDAFLSVSMSTSPRKKTARMVPSRRLPRRLPLEGVKEEGQSVSDSTFRSVFGLPAEKFESVEAVANVEDVPMDIDELSPQEVEPSDVGVAQATDKAQRRSSSADLKAVSLSSTTPSVEPSGKPEGPSTKVELRVSTGPSVPPPQSFDKPLSASTVNLYAVPPHSPPLRQLDTPILPHPVSALDPPLDLDFKIPTRLQAEPPDGQTSTSEKRFDGKMTVVHSIQGRPFTYTHVIDMSLSDSLLSSISKWVNRRAEPSHAPGSICVSLACYHLPEFFETMRSENGPRSIEELTFQSSCSWPASNRLSLHVKRDTKDTIVTLSPPLFVTPDQCVDISSLLTAGTNIFEIKQLGDLSDYALVIHAHHPTRRQLAELEMVTAADERWKRFLEAICVKVEPGPGPAGKVRGTEGGLLVGGGTEGVVGAI